MATATTTKRHPIRGFLYGILLGLGLAFIGIGQGWIALGTWPPLLLLIGGIVIGTLWSTFGPAKEPKGPPPDAPEPAMAAMAETAPSAAAADEGTADDDVAATDGDPAVDTEPVDTEPVDETDGPGENDEA